MGQSIIWRNDDLIEIMFAKKQNNLFINCKNEDEFLFIKKHVEIINNSSYFFPEFQHLAFNYRNYDDFLKDKESELLNNPNLQLINYKELFIISREMIELYNSVTTDVLKEFKQDKILKEIFEINDKFFKLFYKEPVKKIILTKELLEEYSRILDIVDESNKDLILSDDFQNLQDKYDNLLINRVKPIREAYENTLNKMTEFQKSYEKLLVELVFFLT